MLKKDEHHDCKLTPEEDVLVTYIHEGKFVLARRKFKKFFMINENGKYTRDCFKSKFLIDREKMFHLKHYYYMIHPFSRAKEYYDILLAITLFLSILSIKTIIENLILTNIFNIIILLEIVRSFITGRYRQEFNDTVLNPKKVARLYLKGWFTGDIFMILPQYLLSICDIFDLHKSSRYDDVFFIAYITLVIRIIKYFMLLTVIKEHQGFSVIFFKPVRIITVTIMVILWISYALYILAIHQSEPFLNIEMDKYLIVVRRSFTIFFLYGVVGESAKDIWVIAVEIIMINLGFLFYLYLMVEFIQLTYMYLAARNKNEWMNSRLYLFAEYKNLPDSLKYNLLKSFEFKFHKTYFNEELILSTITGQLKREIMEFYAQSFSSKLQAFNLIPIAYMANIMAKMNVRLYYTGQIIFGPNEKRGILRCIYIGTAAVYSSTGKETRHLHDGDYFGYIDDDDSIETVLAVEISKVYSITFQELKIELSDMSEIYETIVHTAKTNLRKTHELSLHQL